MSDEVETNILHLGQPSGDGKKGMSDIADKIYAATGLTLGAEAAAAIEKMIQAESEKLRAALQWLLNDLEDYPASARPIAAYDNARAALGEKE